MLRLDYLKKLLTTLSPLIILLIGIMGGFYLNETSTETELKLASVNYESRYVLVNNNETELLKIMPVITLYNTKRSDYPAKLFPAKNQIIDSKNQEIISESPSGLGDSIVLPGEAVDIHSSVDMILNETGNYTLQTTVYYLDLKTGDVEKIKFYMDFYVYPNSKYDKDRYPYLIRQEKQDIYSSLWNLGQKYPLAN